MLYYLNEHRIWKVVVKYAKQNIRNKQSHSHNYAMNGSYKFHVNNARMYVAKIQTKVNTASTRFKQPTDECRL